MNDWDPNVLFSLAYEYRVYGTEDLSVYAMVDRIDYTWAVQWLWSPKYSRGGKKFYLRRAIQQLHQSQFYCENEKRLVRVRTQRTLFLHSAIMKRKGIPRPSPQHIVDHEDGDGLNCRRSNLRWATLSENNANARRIKHRSIT